MASTKNARATYTASPYDDKGWVSASIAFTTTANQLAQNETMALFDIPAYAIIEDAFLNVRTADTDVTDVDLGISTDGSTNDTLVDGASLATTGTKRGGTNAVVSQKVGATAVQVVLTNKDSDTINGAVVEVWVKFHVSKLAVAVTAV